MPGSPNGCSAGAAAWSQRRLLGFDLETTGVDRFADRPVSAALVETVGQVAVTKRYRLVDPGVPVPAEAAAVHGITTEQAVCGTPLEQAVRMLHTELTRAAADGIVVVGMNLAYDLTMLDVWCRRLLDATVTALDLLVADVLVIDRHFDRYRRGSRRLADLAGHHGVELVQAHDALADVEAAIAVLHAQVVAYPELGAMDPRELTRCQVRWHREWAANFSAHRRRSGGAPLRPDELCWPIADEPIEVAAKSDPMPR
jgi:DNA polymerase-3 subunit epsilon